MGRTIVLLLAGGLCFTAQAGLEISALTNGWGLRIPCAPSNSYRFQWATNLNGPWLNLAEAVADSEGWARFQHTNAPPVGSRVYRALPAYAGGFRPRLPPMGWNSWYHHGPYISEDLVRSVVDAIKTNGYDRYGYQYVNLDEGWASLSRDTNGDIIAFTNRFSSGSLQSVADYVHAHGLLFGLYTETGPGLASGNISLTSFGHFDQDAAKYAEWGVDYVKCDGPAGIAVDDPRCQDLRDAFAAALARTGKGMFINSSVGPWRPWFGGCLNSHRWTVAAGDMNTFRNLLAWLDELVKYRDAYSPGFWVDLDPIGSAFFTESEMRAHYTMICMVSSPLLLSSIPNGYGGRYDTNVSMIAINQDPAGIVAYKPWSNNLAEVWSKPLGSNDSAVRAVALLNRNFTDTNITVYWTNAGVPPGLATVKDLWAQSILGYFTNSFATNVAGHGAECLLITPGKVPPFAPGTNYLSDYFWLPGTGTNGNGTPVGRDRTAQIPPAPLVLRGVTHPKGLGLGPLFTTGNASVSYFLGKSIGSFHATIGGDDCCTNASAGTIDVRIYLDRVQIFSSGPLSATSAPLTVDLDLSGGNLLTLTASVLSDPGNIALDLADAYVITPLP